MTPIASQRRGVREGAGIPKRIQRQRARGWKKPPRTICVTRGTPWGNPFVVRPDVDAGTRFGCGYIAVPTLEDAIECFRINLKEHPESFPPISNLRGKNLACWCPLDQPCHADVLLELAREQSAKEQEGRDR